MKKMQRGEYDIDEETEARILGLQKDEKAVVVGKSSNGQQKVAVVQKEASVCCNIF